MRIPKMTRHQTGQWYVRIGGKSKYLGVDREAAENRYRELVVEHYGAMPGAAAGGTQITVAELLNDYMKATLAACPEKWRRTKENVFTQVKRHVVELYGELTAEAFGPKSYKETRKAMVTGGARKGKVGTRSHSYVNMLCTRLKAAWKWGVSEEVVSESAYRRLLTVPDLDAGDLGLSNGRDVQPVPKELFDATLPFVTDECADFLKLLWLSGARPGELIALTPAELLKDGKHWVYRPNSHKTSKKNKLRAIVFGGEGAAILKKYWPGESTGRFFEHYSDTAVVRNAVYRACARGKLQRWHPYQLRHAAITRISLKHGKEVAQAVAGHAKVLMTDRYDHGSVERAKRAAS